jgi:5-methylcytosine-specific restriction endonuclease McrA
MAHYKNKERGEKLKKKKELSAQDIREKEYLNKLAIEVRDRLYIVKSGTPISLYRKLKSYRTNTNGWLIELGSLKGHRTNIQIWLDFYTNLSERKIWYGFASTHKNNCDNIVKSGEKRIGKPYKLFDDDLIIDKKTRYYKVAVPFNKTDFGRPFIEQYDKSKEYAKEYYYGVYEHHIKSFTNRSAKSIIKRIVEFIETLSGDLPGSKPHDPERDIFPRVENRKLVSSHVIRERNGYLIRLRKELDHFKCQICGIRFEDVYGIIGQEFAEAHHKIPLSKLKGKVATSIEHLITVCANCHRMLHRLNGEPRDILYLKKQFGNRNKKRRK